MNSPKRGQATRIIEEHFRALKSVRPNEDVLVSARRAGRRMVEIYRLLTGHMPQAEGIECEYRGDELPGVEYASPTERDPNDVYYVHPGQDGQPDVLVPGDQHEDESGTEDSEAPQRSHRPPKLLGG